MNQSAIIHVNVLCCAQSLTRLTLCDHMDHSLPGPSIPGDSPGKNTAVGYHALLQRIFPSQGSDLCLLRLLHWQTGSLPPDSFPAIRVMNYWSEELREMCGQTVHVPLLTSIHRDDALLAVEVGFFKSMNTLHLSNNLLCWEL